MNKKLIALAVAGACFAPTVTAQTANPVTLYGRIFLTVEDVKADGGTAPLSHRIRMEDQASYLGVRGTEDLGGGLKAFFQLETAFNPESSLGTFANRNSGVGLQGGWGSVILGRWDTPMKTTQTAVDPWGDLTPGDITGANLDQGNFSRRQSNMIQYWSPDWSGITLRVGYAPNEGKVDATATTVGIDPSLTSISLALTSTVSAVMSTIRKRPEIVMLVSSVLPVAHRDYLRVVSIPAVRIRYWAFSCDPMQNDVGDIRVS